VWSACWFFRFTANPETAPTQTGNRLGRRNCGYNFAANEVTVPLPIAGPVEHAGNGRSTHAEQEPMQQILLAMMAFRNGDFTHGCRRSGPACTGRLPTLSMISSLPVSGAQRKYLACAVTVGKEGRLKQRMVVPDAAAVGPMKSSRSTILSTTLSGDDEVTRAIGAVAKGDLDQAMALEVDGHPLEANSCARRSW